MSKEKHWLAGLLTFSSIICSFSSNAMEGLPNAYEDKHLRRHGISLLDQNTWPNKQNIELQPDRAPDAFLLKIDHLQNQYSIDLQTKPSGDDLIAALQNLPVSSSPTTSSNIVNLLTENIAGRNTVRTFIVNNKPYFVNFYIDPDRVKIQLISTPINIFVTSTKKVSAQLGIDTAIFGLIENREGELVGIGVQKDVLKGYGQDGDCIFKPEHPELEGYAFGQFNNVYGGVYVPNGKALVSAKDSIINGRGVETKATLTFTNPEDPNGVKKYYTHKFYERGNGSFMWSGKGGMLLNSEYISDPYNNITVKNGDLVLQGPRETATIRITGTINMDRGLWVMTNIWDLRQERERAFFRMFGPEDFKEGEIALSDTYPQMSMNGPLNVSLNMVYLNHPSGGWQNSSGILTGVHSGQDFTHHMDYPLPKCIRVFPTNLL